MHGVALLLGLLAAGCLYAASPNQALLAPGSLVRGRVLCAAALVMAAIAVVLWNDVLGWAGAAIGVLLVVAGGLSLWPMAGAWVQQRRHAAEARP
ncbi:hypothetical protein PQH03_25410 [Ralstonia insidiosa]|jgi:hypothetical protein|nr:hypothetical protein [Ralstonia insidiosa]KMW45615.1 hypothetical protein AC240_19200 [Ralstonia sp. MD27]MBX3772451.1 hypothetical protein [Ralstonia pickettii]NOZ15658.1 hypothetical protein [Betaproteobacteria bacterium]MBA9857107.1 hypothetical protein [Ralstonia insidiosa]MBA9870209.1 hypothetical protein [Ralstonia insidiosa]